MRKKLLILIPCLLLVAAAALCLLHFRPCEGSRFSRRGGEDEFLLAFHPLNGVLEDVYTLAEGDQIDVRIAHEKGRLDVLVAREGETPLYTGNDAQSGSFTLIVTEPGDYTLRVSGQHAYGRADFTIRRAEAVPAD